MTTRSASRWSVELTSTLTPEALEQLGGLYHRSFAPLATRAAARHLLTSEEFAEEMADTRVEKYVARGPDDPDGVAVGLTTLTADLDAVPWISGDYYRHHWPEHAASGRLYYLGFTLADPSAERSGVFEAMLEAFADRMAAEDAVMAYDMCGLNVASGFAAACEELFGDRCAAPPQVVDTQQYFVADFGGRGTR